MNRLCFAFVVTTATCAAAHAQDLSKIPPPHMPVVSVPTDAKWVLALSKDSDNSSTTSTGAAPAAPKKLDPAMIVSVSSIKTGKLKLDQLTFGDGHENTFWYLNGMYFFQKVNGKPFMAVVGPGWNQSDPTVPDGFPGTTWIQVQNYSDTVSYDKQPCYHFKTNIDGLAWEAWINALTHLPVAYSVGMSTYVYEFSAPPTSQLTLPEEFNPLLADSQKQVDYANKLNSALDYSARLQQMGK